MFNPLIALTELWLGRYRARASQGTAATTAGRPAVVITGASEGIGLALAHRFAAAGNSVVMIARHAELLEAAAEDVRQRHGVDAVALALDVVRPDAAGVIDAVLEKRGYYVDVLVNNAGVGLCGGFVDSDPAEVEALITLNVQALSRLTRHVLPAMLERGRGGVLNIASLAGYAPGPFQAAYYASKAYVIALTRAVGYETRGLGLRVSVAVPGPVDTRFHERMGAEASLYRHYVPAASAEAVANSCYRGFRLGLGVIYPGLLTPVAALAMRVLPGIILLPIIGLMLRPRREGHAGH